MQIWVMIYFGSPNGKNSIWRVCFLPSKSNIKIEKYLPNYNNLVVDNNTFFLIRQTKIGNVWVCWCFDWFSGFMGFIGFLNAFPRLKHISLYSVSKSLPVNFTAGAVNSAIHRAEEVACWRREPEREEGRPRAALQKWERLGLSGDLELKKKCIAALIQLSDWTEKNQRVKNLTF